MEWIDRYGVYALGFFAQSMFGARLVVQLFLSERKGKVVSPTIFWQLSLVASFLFMVYGVIRNDMIIICGQSLSYMIYVRNLQLKNAWHQIPGSLRPVLLALPFATFAWLIFGPEQRFFEIVAATEVSEPLVVIGGVGQLLLNFRFVYQWYHSEKIKTSVLPPGFWIISCVASLMILGYAVYRMDPVLLVAQGMGTIVYVRNIFIHFRSRAVHPA